MTDTEALVAAFIEEVVRRVKAEAVAANTLKENARLAAELAEMKNARS